MKALTTHHDGFKLNSSIIVEAVDEPGPGGARHEYRLSIKHAPDEAVGYVGNAEVATIQFQRGPRNEPGSLPGVTEGALLAVLIDRLQAFQAGEFKCEENRHTLRHLQEALHWTKARSRNRAARGVLGTVTV